jgi:hypothetical protein
MNNESKNEIHRYIEFKTIITNENTQNDINEENDALHQLKNKILNNKPKYKEYILYLLFVILILFVILLLLIIIFINNTKN